MVIFEQTLRDILIGFNLVANRVFLMRAPQVPAAQQQYPYMVFTPVAQIPLQTIHGPLDQIYTTYQISIFDKSQSRALAIALSLRGDMDTYNGVYDNVRIGACLFLTQSQQWE